MRTKVVVTILTVLLLIATAWGLQGYRTAQAQGTPTPTPAQTPTKPVVTLSPRTVSVTGMGSISATPDQATITMGVTTEGDTSAEALDANSEQMASLIAALRAAGIASRDIQTSNFSIYPQYRDVEAGRYTISGYEVSNTVTVTVRDLTNIGTTLDAAVEAGGNRVSSISFGFNDPSALIEEARQAAMANAQANATQLAELADLELGQAITISENSFNMPMPIERGAMMDTASAVPIEAGQSAVSVSVSVTYEME